jgi:DNA-binding NarL/FixJ family response regulator
MLSLADTIVIGHTASSDLLAAALVRKRAEGVVPDRPKGRKNTRLKLTGREPEIARLLALGHSQTHIARRLNVHRLTLGKFMRNFISAVEG